MICEEIQRKTRVSEKDPMATRANTMSWKIHNGTLNEMYQAANGQSFSSPPLRDDPCEWQIVAHPNGTIPDNIGSFIFSVQMRSIHQRWNNAMALITIEIPEIGIRNTFSATYKPNSTAKWNTSLSLNKLRNLNISCMSVKMDVDIMRTGGSDGYVINPLQVHQLGRKYTQIFDQSQITRMRTTMFESRVIDRMFIFQIHPNGDIALKWLLSPAYQSSLQVHWKITCEALNINE